MRKNVECERRKRRTIEEEGERKIEKRGKSEKEG